MNNQQELNDLKEENARLKEALKPFANYKDTMPQLPKNSQIGAGSVVTIGVLRKASETARELC